jgi:uncharacterized membrane protein YdbT with pleckstrin-like domain
MIDLQLKGLLAAVIIGAIVGVVSALSHTPHHVQVGWVVAAVVVVLAITFLIAFFRRMSTTYTITSRRLTIRIGLLSKEQHETRLDRVQNVSTSQSLLERMLGIGTVDFDTAGSAGFDFAFRGVGRPEEIVRTVNGALQAEGLPAV